MVVGLTILALALARVLDTSWVLQVFVMLMLVTAALGAVVARLWKISMHTLVIAASIVVLIALDTRLEGLMIPLPLVNWARLRLGYTPQRNCLLAPQHALGCRKGHGCGRTEP